MKELYALGSKRGETREREMEKGTETERPTQPSMKREEVQAQAYPPPPGHLAVKSVVTSIGYAGRCAQLSMSFTSFL